MIDLLLVQPPMVSRMGKDLGARILGANLGLAYIASYLEKQGFSVRVLDCLAEGLSLPEFVRKAGELAPRCVGFSAMTYQVKSAAAAAALLKRQNPEVRILVGGSHASTLPERTLEEFPAFDVAVLGEGEVTTAELLDQWLRAGQGPEAGTRSRSRTARGAGAAPKLVTLTPRASRGKRQRPTARRPAEQVSPDAVMGTCYRRDGRIELAESRPFIQDLDTLPFPAFHLFPLSRYFPFYSRTYKPELPISSSRGCPQRCSFCNTAMGKRIRLRSPESLVAEIRDDRDRYAAEQIVFTDENFTGNRKRALAFCEQIVAAGLHRGINYICQSRVAVDREILVAMKQANFTHVTFGIESGNQEVLDRAHKGIRLEQSEQAVRWAHEQGMVTDGNFILGLPHDTRETILESIRFACRLPLDYASFFLLVPYPGTEVMEMARAGKANLVLLSEDWDEYGKQVGGALAHRHLPRRQLELLQTYGYGKFYLRPRQLLGLFRKVTPQTAFRFLGHTLRNLVLPGGRG